MVVGAGAVVGVVLLCSGDRASTSASEEREEKNDNNYSENKEAETHKAFIRNAAVQRDANVPCFGKVDVKAWVCLG